MWRFDISNGRYNGYIIYLLLISNLNFPFYISFCARGFCKKIKEFPYSCLIVLLFLPQLDVFTAAGLIVHITRGCVDECSVVNTCKLKSRTGKCKACCTDHLCNSEYPDIENTASSHGGGNFYGFTAMTISCIFVWWSSINCRWRPCLQLKMEF